MFDKNFFIEHQKPLLQALNNPLAGWAARRGLWIEDRKHPVVKITPESYHVLLPDGKVKATIYATNQYAQALHKNAKPLWEALHWWDKIANRLVPSLNAGFDTYTSQPNGTAGLDTYIESLNPTSNFGTSAEIGIGEQNNASTIKRTLIKFDFSSIPSGSIASSATFSLWLFGDWANNARTFRGYRSKRDWVETQATWNIWKTSNNWSTAGGFHADDCEQTEITSRAMSASEANGEKQWTTWDLSALSAMFGSSSSWTNNGFLFKADTESEDGYQYRSSDYGTAGERPKMVIEYTVASGGRKSLALLGVA